MSSNNQRAVLRIKEQMRRGAALKKLQTVRGPRWFTMPCSEVSDEVAELVIREADVWLSWRGYQIGGENEPEEQRVQAGQK